MNPCCADTASFLLYKLEFIVNKIFGDIFIAVGRNYVYFPYDQFKIYSYQAGFKTDIYGRVYYYISWGNLSGIENSYKCHLNVGLLYKHKTKKSNKLSWV